MLKPTQYQDLSDGQPVQPSEGRRTMERASDCPRVLGGRESRLQGEGGNSGTQPGQEPQAGLSDRRPYLDGTSKELRTPSGKGSTRDYEGKHG